MFNEKKRTSYNRRIKKIVGIRASINKGLSEVLINSFPDVITVARPLVNLREIPSPHWLVGFIEAEVCFFVAISKSKAYTLGSQIIVRFSIGQHSRDTELLSSFIKHLGGPWGRPLRGRLWYYS